jgi:RNA polymerase sigma-70 factor, ECF subfamily
VTDEAACGLSDALGLARCGDPAAFTALVRRHQRLVYGVALRMLGDRHEAEDLAQEVFMRLHSRLAQLQSDAHLVGWLRQVATRLAIDRLRRGSRREMLSLEEDPGILQEPADGDPLLQRRLRALIAQLPAAARAVVVLRYQQDLDPTEIAATLAMPINTVKSHLKRSLQSLRDKLGSAADAPAASSDRGSIA